MTPEAQEAAISARVAEIKRRALAHATPTACAPDVKLLERRLADHLAKVFKELNLILVRRSN